MRKISFIHFYYLPLSKRVLFNEALLEIIYILLHSSKFFVNCQILFVYFPTIHLRSSSCSRHKRVIQLTEISLQLGVLFTGVVN